MLTLNKQQTKAGLQIDLGGTIEESVDFEQLVGSFTGELWINCKNVTRINSIGVKTWMRYFIALRQRGVVFKFFECSYPIIEQLNMITNFACGGEVVSILLPFSCIKCQNEFVASCKTSELKSNGLKIPNVKCEKSDCAAQFDDDAEEYLYFLE